jgi:hypothetical protein
MASTTHLEDKNEYNILLENMKGKDHSQDPSVEGMLILKWILRREGVDWIILAQDRDR